MFSAAKTILLSFSKRPPDVSAGTQGDKASSGQWGLFEIRGEIGRGSFGTVYKALDPVLNREVALKLFRGESSHLDEARKLAQIPSHRNIVTVYSCGTFEGVPGIAMELVQGETLSAVLARSGRLAAGVAISLTVEVCRAAAELHAHGIIHRDIKAQNVMQGTGGRVLLMDLSLAEYDNANQRQLAGTLPYMAPELLRHEAASRQSDIYAIGILLFHLLTGSFPITGKDVEEFLWQHERGVDIASLCRTSKVPRPLTRIIGRALHAEPRLRYSSAAHLSADLQRCAEVRTRQRRVAAAVAAGLTVLAVAALSLRPPNPPPVPLTQVTSFDGYTTDPAVSADGKWLAFASDLGGRGDSDIYVQPVSGGKLRRITDNPADELQPTLSPNGQEVAYRSERNMGGVFVRSIDGGPERLLARFGDNPRFSPDGRLVAFEQTNEGNLGRPSGKIFVVSVAGGPPRQLFSDLPDARYPTWMDRRQLLFQACSPGCINPRMESDWWIGSVDGGNATRLRSFARLTAQNIDLFLSPAFVREGFVYFGARQVNSTNIWRMPIRRNLLHIRDGAQQLTSSTEQNSSPAVSPDGRVYFAASNSRVNLWLAPVSGPTSGNVRRVTNYPEIDSFPSISEDGRRLLYFRRQGNSRLLVLQDGGAERTRPVETESRGLISADGNRIAYSRPSGNRRDILLLDRFEGEPQLLCHNCGEVVDAPGSDKYVLESEGVPSRIYAIDTETGSKSLILSDPARSIDQASLSPDGAWLVFLAVTDQEHSQLFAASTGDRLVAGSWIPITNNDNWNDRPRWSRDGNQIVFISNRDDFRCIWSQGLTVGKKPLGPPKHLVPFHRLDNTTRALTRNALNLSVSKDGVLFNTALHSGNIWSTVLPD